MLAFLKVYSKMETINMSPNLNKLITIQYFLRMYRNKPENQYCHTAIIQSIKNKCKVSQWFEQMLGYGYQFFPLNFSASSLFYFTLFIHLRSWKLLLIKSDWKEMVVHSWWYNMSHVFLWQLRYESAWPIFYSSNESLFGFSSSKN